MRVRGATAPSSLGSGRGPLLLGTLCVVPLLLWAQPEELADRFASRYTALTSVAVLLALAGTSAFALNLVLGARLRLVETLFGGLDRMYRAHRATGKIAFSLLLGHGVLIVASRATISTDAAIDVLAPGAGWSVFAGVLAFTAMTVAIALTLFVRLGHEVFVYVQRSFGFVFLAATYHVLTTADTRGESTALRAYLVVLSTLGLGAFVYRSVLGNVLVRRRRYRVTAVNRLDESVTEIVMEPVGKLLTFVPGQFVFVSFRSLELRRALHPVELSVERQVLSVRAGEIANQFHPFSITSAPGERALRITVKAVGDYTGALRQLEPGAEAVVEGAYGSFSHLNVAAGRQLWLAGGIGVTPFLSMARSLEGDGGPSVDFYYCVEHDDEAHFLAELDEIAARRSDFRVVVTARDRDGLLTAARLVEEHGELASTDVLICGPPAMIAGLREQLEAVGVPSERIHAEEFSFAKVGGGGAAQRVTPDLERHHAAPGKPQWSEARTIAVLAALGLAGLTFAIGLVVGNAAIPGSAPDRSRPERSTTVPLRPGSADAGRLVFASAGCGDCHAFSAAGSTGSVGPDLDDAEPDSTRVLEIVTSGKGAMPAFDGELTPRQIRDLAAFVSTSGGS